MKKLVALDRAAYAAEESVETIAWHLLTMDELVSEYRRITTSKVWKKGKFAVPTLHGGKNLKDAEAWWVDGQPSVGFPRCDRNLMYVCHELAHVLQGPDDPVEHSKVWAAHYVFIVREFVGEKVADKLHKALKKGKVL